VGADLFIASGDSRRSLAGLADFGISPENIYPVASPKRKQKIVNDLKKSYKKVVMVGDGLNDIYALDAADVGILTIQQDTGPTSELVQTADWIIADILDLLNIISKVKG
jgi:soluble P-type ATPase